MPAVRIAFWLLLAAAPPAWADLYRWVDSETGSVKFSNFPPSEAASGKRTLQVELIPYGTPVAAAPQLAPVKPAPAQTAAAQVATPAAGKPQGDAKDLLGALQERWRALRNALAAMPTRQDFDRAGSGFQSQADAYKAVSAELDRMDPAGAARRRAEAEQGGMLDRLAKGFAAQLPGGGPQVSAPAKK